MHLLKTLKAITIVAAGAGSFSLFTTASFAAPTATPAPAAATLKPPFKVHIEGQGPPMILIPGLMCDASVWTQTIAHFKTRYQCHALTLPGFAGVPPVTSGPFTTPMRDAIILYIRNAKLEKPVIIGHSLGAHLALAIASEAPALVGPIVAVDGGPATGALMFPQATKELIATQAAMMAQVMAAATPEALTAQSKMTFLQMVKDPVTADALAKIGGKSDPKTVGRAMQEILTSDIRPGLTRIQAPVLMMAAPGHVTDKAGKDALLLRYEDQVKNVPNHKVILADGSRHFIMLDAPGFFLKSLDTFLAAPR